MTQTIAPSNASLPAPRWYRRAKRVIGLASGPTFFAFIQVFNPTDHQLAMIGEIIAFLPTILEIFSAVLTNGEEYAPAGTVQNLEVAKTQLADAGIKPVTPAA